MIMVCAIQLKGMLIIGQVYNNPFLISKNGKRAAIQVGLDGIKGRHLNLATNILCPMIWKLKCLAIAVMDGKATHTRKNAIGIFAQINSRRVGR